MGKVDIVSDVLEPLIDKYGLSFVLTGLELVCSEKAEHIRHNWQDKTLARAWDAEAERIRKVAAAVKV